MFNLDESAMLNSNTGAAAALDSIVRVCRRQARKSIDRNMVPYYHYVLHSRLLCRGYSWLTGWSGSAIGSLINGSSPPPQKVSLFLLPVSLSQLSTTFFVHHFQQPCIQYTCKIISENATLCINRPSSLTHFTSNRCNVDKISINNS